MVVRARLAWIREAIVNGHAVHACFSGASERGRTKVKLLVHPGVAVTSDHQKRFMLAAIDLVVRLEPTYVSVDRGHKHSSGISEINIWFAETPQGATHRVDDTPPDDGPPPPPDDDHRPRRGRSPPADFQDPWSRPGGDPWASSAAASASAPRRSPPRKFPRQSTAVYSPWYSWVPSASITPDPPWTRPPVRRGRFASTGTPPLTVAESQDGLFVATGAAVFSDGFGAAEEFEEQITTHSTQLIAPAGPICCRTVEHVARQIVQDVVARSTARVAQRRLHKWRCLCAKYMEKKESEEYICYGLELLLAQMQDRLPGETAKQLLQLRSRNACINMPA